MQKSLLVLIASVTALAGCATSTTSRSSVHVFHNGFATKELPACLGKDPTFWNNCNGYTVVMFDGKAWSHTEGRFVNGKLDGDVRVHNFHNETICRHTVQLGQIEGWSTCTRGSSVTSRDFHIQGKTSAELTSTKIDEESRRRCLSYGFKDATADMGNCILKLRGEAQVSREPPSVSSTDRQRTTAEKLDGAAQLLQGIQDGIQSAQPNNRQAPTLGGKATGTAYLRSQSVSGLNRICIYDRMGSGYSITIAAAQACPVSQ